MPLHLLSILFRRALNRVSIVLSDLERLSVLAAMVPLCTIAAPASSTELGVHWVVVIRNTVSMKGEEQDALVKTLPALLFHTSEFDSVIYPKLPVFNLKHDHLSLVFAAVHDSGKYLKKYRVPYPPQCLEDLKKRDRTAQLDQFYITKGIYKSMSSEHALTRLLTKTVKKDPCLFKGFDFNEYIAENAVVPYLRAKLPQITNTKTTIIVLANNKYGSLSITKSDQIDKFESSYQQARDFRKDYITINPANWVFNVSAERYRMRKGLGLDLGKNKILLRYKIAQATYLPGGLNSLVGKLVSYKKQYKSVVEQANKRITDIKGQLNDANRGRGAGDTQVKKWMITAAMLTALAFIGPWLTYKYMRSKNKICIPD